MEGKINWFDHEDHACTTAVGAIINGFVFIFGPVAKVVNINFDKIFILSSFDNRGIEWAGEHFREKGEDVNNHCLYILAELGGKCGN